MGRYVKIAEIHEIPKHKMRIFEVDGRKIIVVNIEGKFYAFENRCPHMDYPLYYGSLEGTVITCGFHNAKFDVTTGKSLSSVTDKPLRMFNAKVQNSSVSVEL